MDSTEIDNDNNITKAVLAANDADFIVLCIGENTYTEGLGSISDLNIDDGQMQLSQSILATNKPVVVVYLGKIISFKLTSYIQSLFLFVFKVEDQELLLKL